MSQTNKEQQFYQLDPQRVMEALESSGFWPTGEFLQLNSYENRVFDIFLEKEFSDPQLKDHVIAKFYRPHRWSLNALKEEHEFLFELQKNGFPCIAPLLFAKNKTESLAEDQGLYFTLFPKGRGRLPQELNLRDLETVGQSLAQLHNIGAQKKSQHRPNFTVPELGDPALELLEKWVAPEVWPRYQRAAHHILDFLDQHLEEDHFIRIHGDCHRGNLIQHEFAQNDQWLRTYFFVDFDDFVMGPEAQDFWLLFSDEIDYQAEFDAILKGYEKLRTFPYEQETLFPALRGFRIIRYGAWIAQRWKDPTFPQLFPQFTSYNYWAEEVDTLERLARRL